ncbi:MAG: hypothetical protein COA94_04820 [Rickettsiales bacterium]|nr:MAG: hypothetical protein COA94_04820 [Rickettsiales bacterium]
MSNREISDWLDGYLKYTYETEPPVTYHTWVGLSLIAGALQRKVYFKWGHDTLYPNLYVVLVGPSGRARKGTAMNIGKDIISSIDTIRVASESITREALIRDMKDAVNQYQDSTSGRMIFHCSMTVMSEELSVFLRKNDNGFLSDLTDWFDSRDTWTYRTKGAGTDKIQGVCVNLLGATAPDWLPSILPQEAVGGGFTSRIIFVVEEDKGKTVPEPKFTEEMHELRISLKKDLEKISLINGEVTFTPEAKQLYIDWYVDFERKISEGKTIIDDPRFSGYLDRRATHMRKVAMVCSMSRNSDLFITTDDFNRADSLLHTVEAKMPKAFGGLGRASYSEMADKVITYIRDNKVVKRSDLLRKFYRDVDPATMEMIEMVMNQMQLVSMSQDPLKGEVTYKYLG